LNSVPITHIDLLQSTVDVVLTTISPKGYPQSTMVWCSFDGTNVCLNTGIGYQKEKNMRRNPRVAVFSFDPKDHLRWIEVQGNAELNTEGAVEHLDRLSLAYTGNRNFYRDVMPELAGKEERVIVRVTPVKVRLGNGVGTNRR
jgi:PPOX class probable F420-dependent enzyme